MAPEKTLIRSNFDRVHMHTYDLERPCMPLYTLYHMVEQRFRHV